jgi:hypothetical protein
VRPEVHGWLKHGRRLARVAALCPLRIDRGGHCSGAYKLAGWLVSFLSPDLSSAATRAIDMKEARRCPRFANLDHVPVP